MKKILYLSCHCVLEYDELRLLRDIGYEVYTTDCYHRPKTPVIDRRPPLDIDDNEDFLRLFYSMCHTNSQNSDVKQEQHNNLLTEEIIDAFDIIMVMHLPRFVEQNWEKMKHKTVIWRTIGQSSPIIERDIQKYRDEGLKIVRYSPKERELSGFAGEDALIRFAKYPTDYLPYVGDQNYVMTFGQTAVDRGDYCRYDLMRKISNDFNFKLFGPGNTSSPLNFGEINYEKQMYELSRNKAYFYSGTWPASYTLNFIEALMSGIPVFALGEKLASKVGYFPYEVPDIIKSGQNGFCSDDIDLLKQSIRNVMTDPELRAQISKEGRNTAIELFGADNIKPQWKEFLNNI